MHSRVSVSRVAIIGLIVAAILFPLLIPFGSLGTAHPETWRHLSSTVLPRYVLNTIALSVGTAFIAGGIGIVTAWIVSQYRFPGRGILRWALVLPLAFPLYVSAYAYGGVFAYDGSINGVWLWIQRVFVGSTDSPSYVSIRNLPGLILVSSFTLYPYVYLTVRNWFESQGARMLEAGRALSRELPLVYRLGVPISRPALVGGAALVMMETLNEYGAPLHFGVGTLTTGIFRAWFALADVQAALQLSILVLLLVFALLVAERLSRGRARYAAEVRRGGTPVPRRLSGRYALLAGTISVVPVVIGFLIPIGRLLGWAVYAGDEEISGLLARIARSGGLASGAAVLITVFTLFLSHQARRLPGKVGSSLAQLATIGYAIPGAVIAVGMLQFARLVTQQIPGVMLIGTIGLLLGAYLVRFLGVAFHPTQAGFDLAGGRVRESALSLGAGNFTALVRVELPSMWRVVVGAIALVFVDALKELPLTLVLRPFNFETLATTTFRFAGDERLVAASIPALILVAVGCIAVFVLERVIGGNNAARP